MLDLKYRLSAPPVAGTSNPASAGTSFGGVARNVAENLAGLGVQVALVTAVGDDAGGLALAAHLRARGVGVAQVERRPGATAQYVAVLDPAGDLVLGIAAMDVLDEITADRIESAWTGDPGTGDLDPEPDGGSRDGGTAGEHCGTAAADWLFCDANLSAGVLADVLQRAGSAGLPVAVDAVSTPKATRLPADLSGIAVLSCNADEARTWLRHHGGSRVDPNRVGEARVDDDSVTDGLVADGLADDGPVDGGPVDGDRVDDDRVDARRVDDGLALARRLRNAGAGGVLLTLGAAGVVVAQGDGERWLPAVPAAALDVTGAGDALIAGTLAGLLAGGSLADAVAVGTALAAHTVASPQSVLTSAPGDVLALLADLTRRRVDRGRGGS